MEQHIMYNCRLKNKGRLIVYIKSAKEVSIVNHAAGFYNFYHIFTQLVLRETHRVETENHGVHTERIEY
jgi:hypothetical protein